MKSQTNNRANTGKRQMVIRAATVGLTMALLTPWAQASERGNEAIDECRDLAVKEHKVERSEAKFWQMTQTGRYIRVWLKVKDDDKSFKTLCKVHKRDRAKISIKAL